MKFGFAQTVGTLTFCAWKFKIKKKIRGVAHYICSTLYRFCFCVPDLGLKAKAFMDEGKLVPDDVITKIMLNELKKHNKENWLLDGNL